jgi:hypothetical protein
MAETPAQRMVALLADPDFQSAVSAFRKPSTVWGTTEEVRQATEPGGALDQAGAAAIAAFKAKWGVTPPHPVLLDETAPRAEAEALRAGRVGLIVVYPWTTEPEVTRMFKRHRAEIRKGARIDEDDRLTALAAWLMANGCTATDVGGALLGRTEGLKRLTREDVDRNPRLASKVERCLKAAKRAAIKSGQVDAAGRIPAAAWNAIERQSYADVQGKEAPAAPGVRMRVKHYRDKVAGYAQRREPSDPATAAVVEMMRLHAVLGPDHLGPLGPSSDKLRRALLTPPSA